MTICRPAGPDSALSNYVETVSICKGEALIGKSGDQPMRVFDLCGPEDLNGELWKFFDEVQKLDGPLGVVAAQKPAVAFRDYQCRGC